MKKAKFGSLSVLGKFGRDQRGAILIQFTITVVALMGMIGLALDGGRLLMLHSDLQKLADAAALAGAAKLDGTANAITNADTAARSAGSSNSVHWADVAGPKILSGTAGWQVAPTFVAGAAAFRGVAATSNSTLAKIRRG